MKSLRFRPTLRLSNLGTTDTQWFILIYGAHPEAERVQSSSTHTYTPKRPGPGIIGTEKV